jgi:hypothetical protein
MRRSLYFGLLLAAYFSLLVPQASAGVRFAIDSQAVHFGDVLLSGFKEIQVTITDTSDADISIIDVSSFAAAKDDYAVIDPLFPQILAAHQSIVVTVRFAPLQEGTRSALLMVHSADGDASVLMVGNGVVEHSNLSLSLSAIDMGKVAPEFYKDTTVEVYSTGSDSATIRGVIAANGGGDTSFMAYIDGVTKYPIRLAPGDSLPIRIRFTGLLPIGFKVAKFSVIGAANPTIDLSGDVEWGSYEFDPQTIDFGGMYIGEERDTVLHLRNTSDVDILVTRLDPAYGSFSYIDPPSVPFVLHAHDSIALRLRANPGPNSYNVPDVGAFSDNAASREPKAFFLLTLKRAGLDAPHSQSVDHFCAKPGAVDITVAVTDTVPAPFYITRIDALDSTISVISELPLPDTIHSIETHSYPLHISARDRAKDTIILAFSTGDRRTLFDTVFITARASIANGNLVEVQAPDSLHAAYEVRAGTQLSQFQLDTIIEHIAVGDPNALEIDTASLSLPPGMSNAKIVRVVKEASGYAVWIASSTPIVAPVGSSLLSFNLRRFVSTADSTNVSVTFEAPERAGCIEWSGDTSSVPLLALCGDLSLHEYLSGDQITFSIKDNPVLDGSLNLTVESSHSDHAHIEIRNVLGNALLQGEEVVKAGSQSFTYPVSTLKSGTYFIVVVLDGGRTASLKFSKL